MLRMRTSILVCSLLLPGFVLAGSPEFEKRMGAINARGCIAAEFFLATRKAEEAQQAKPRDEKAVKETVAEFERLLKEAGESDSALAGLPWPQDYGERMRIVKHDIKASQDCESKYGLKPMLDYDVYYQVMAEKLKEPNPRFGMTP